MTVNTCTEKEYLKFKIFSYTFSEIKHMLLACLIQNNYMALKN